MSDHKSTTLTDSERGQVSTTAAEVYEQFFVPALFGQFPGPVLEHARVAPGARVLDVGCGTGILARAAAARVGTNGLVAAVDPNDGMLALARRSDPSIDWRLAAAEELPFATGSFDHTLSQFAAMFFADRACAFGEMARVTVVGGSLTIATWSNLDRTPGYEAMVALLADVLGEHAADALRAPFVLGDPDHAGRLLTDVGSDLRLDEIAGTARFASIADWVHTEVRGWTLADVVDDAAEAALVDRAERDLSAFVSHAGTVEFPAPAVVGTVVVDR